MPNSPISPVRGSAFWWLVGVSWAVIGHTITGIRHFVLDTGAGYELEQNKLWANVSTAAGFVLTALFWAVLLLR